MSKSLSNIDKQALREELSNPAIGSNAHLRKLALALLDELEAKDQRNAELEAREVKLPCALMLRPILAQKNLTANGMHAMMYWLLLLMQVSASTRRGDMDPLLQYACRRVAELESLLLVEVPETVWPAEVGLVFTQLENAGALPSRHQRRLKHHINRMWLESMPVPSIVAAARSLAAAMEEYA